MSLSQILSLFLALSVVGLAVSARAESPLSGRMKSID